MRRVFRWLLIAALLVLPALARADGLVLEPPVPGRVLRDFQLGPTPYSPGHRGVDLAAEVGAEVRAAAEGRIHFAGAVAGRWSVSIDHGDGVRTTYTPVQPTVRKGDVVAKGDVIGRLLPGHCPEGCLHWGLTDGSNYFDPLSYLAARRVRLVPMGSAPLIRADLPAARVPVEPGQPPLPGRAPVPGRVTSPFGMRLHPVTGRFKLHDGTDFGAACGTPISSPWAGTVVNRDVTRGYGYRVHVDHGGGLVTAYAHLPGFEVGVGQRVEAGGRIGVVGNTGYSTGCHLHWMAWHGGRLVDPLPLLRGP